ncbi:TrbC/VirB2 family protein [Providencia rettgeri]
MNESHKLPFLLMCGFMSLLVFAFPAQAADVTTQTTGFLDKIIEFLTAIRKPAITICALGIGFVALFARNHMGWITPLIIGMIIFIVAPYLPEWIA